VSTPISHVEVTCANPDMWEELTITPSLEELGNFLGGAVALWFLADAAGASGTQALLGTFDKLLISRLARVNGQLQEVVPVAATMTLVSVATIEQDPTIRVRLHVVPTTPPSDLSVLEQFWDVLIDTKNAATAPTLCPNCGGPVAAGDLFCRHCRADLRPSSPSALLVTRITAFA
jgi:hypothetical protein